MAAQNLSVFWKKNKKRIGKALGIGIMYNGRRI